MIYKAGKTSQSIDVFIADDSGAGVTGLTYSTVLTNIPSLAYSMGDNTAATAITPVTLAAITTAWASSGFIERSQGWYRFDMPNAMLATAGKSPKIIGDAAGYHLIHEAITVVAYDPQDANALGIAKFSALPSFSPGTSGGLPVLQQVDSTHLFVDAYLRQGWTLQITSPTFSVGDTTLFNADTLRPGSVFRIWSTAGGFAAGEDVYVVDNANSVVRGYNHTTEQDWAIGDNLSFVGFSAPNMVEILNGQGLTTTRAAKLDNADVAVSTIKAKTDNLPASPAAVGSAMTLADGAITAGKIAASALDGKGDWLTTLGTNAPTDWLNAAAIKADAVTAVQSGLATTAGATANTSTITAAITAAVPAVPTAAEVATEVWSSASRTLTDFGALATNVGTLVTKLTGITSLANWLRAMLRSDTPDATAASEINATDGTFDAMTDSMEAIRDRGDAAWLTGSNSSGSLTDEQATELTAIYTVTQRYGTTAPTVVGPQLSSGDIQLVKGDSYDSGAWGVLPFTFEVPGVDLTGWTASLHVQDPATTGVTMISGTVTVPTGSNQQVTVAISNTVAATLQAGSAPYALHLTNAAGTETVTPCTGMLTIQSLP